MVPNAKKHQTSTGPIAANGSGCGQGIARDNPISLGSQGGTRAVLPRLRVAGVAGVAGHRGHPSLCHLAIDRGALTEPGSGRIGCGGAAMRRGRARARNMMLPVWVKPFCAAVYRCIGKAPLQPPLAHYGGRLNML